MSLPAVPARPARTQNIDIPAIPARPKRSVERSVSPNRDSFVRSPFHDPDTFRLSKSPGHSGLSRSVTRDELERVPSVSMPLVGEEGNEYDVVSADSGAPAAAAADPDVAQAAEQTKTKTKTIDSNLPLHAPKASLPVSAATSRIQAVTRTDSNTAAAVGIGRPRDSESSEADSSEHPEHDDKLHQHALQLEHTSRPGSSAPLSRPSSIFKPEEDEQGIPNIGLAVPLLAHVGDVQAPTPREDSTVPASSTSSGIGILHKASSQGLHHFRTKSGREVFERPPGSYGLHGHGVNKDDPFEKAWYEKHPEAKAIEEKGEFGPRNPIERKDYHLSNAQLNRLVQDEANETHSGTPDEQVGYLATEEYTSRLSPRPPSAKRNSTQYNESPLRKVTSNEPGKAVETDEKDENDDDVFHVVATPIPDQGMMPARPTSEFGDAEEAPILAADEVARRPHAQAKEAAVGGFGEDEYTSREQSRAHSRANSVHHETGPLLKHIEPTESHQYEPLFEDDDKSKPLKKTEADDDEQGPRHFFPSKDVWEDTPDSLKYETSVATPQLPEYSVPYAEHEPREIFEKPDTVPRAQRQESAEDAAKLKKNYGGDVLAEMNVQRPRQHRFPSRDVWEDTPDSHLYTTTIVDEPKKPEVPSRPASEGKKSPSVPDRPKPQVPVRPGAKDVESSSKPKPPVPARPLGSKIAAIKGAFMTDLERKLQSGPQTLSKSASASPEEEREEPVEEKAPLVDARKGRAKGPARRKPGASTAAETPKPKVSFLSAVTIWSIDEDGAVEVTRKKPLEEVTPKKPAVTKDEQTQTGTMELVIPKSADSETEKATIYVGGRAPEKGTVVVTEDGVEHVGGEEGLDRVEKVGEQVEAVKAS